jgi:hypothetical protein
VPLVRAGGRGRAAGRCGERAALTADPSPSAEGVPDLTIRNAIELAFAVVIVGMRARPPITPPPSLKPFVRFQKIPPAALGPVRRAVEADDELRARVALAATEEAVGRPSWLWIHRPEGWEAELAQLAAEEAAAESEVEEEKAERSAQRRVDAAERAARKAAAEVSALRAELVSERQQRQRAEQERSKLERRAAQLDVELGGARRRLGEAEARADLAGGELAGLRERVAELEQQVAVVAEAAVPANPGVAEDALARVPAVAPEPDLAPVDGPEPAALDPERFTVASAALAAALAQAARATVRLSAALAAASQAAGGHDAADVAEVVGDAPVHAAPVARGRDRRPRRVPLALPGGMWADAPEAALHLVKSPGVLLLVDGYNVAKLGWPGMALAEQRARVLDALDELAARYGTDVHVVFDGADVGPVARGRRYLRVEFSPPGVTADEVIVRLAEELPVERPVVVATNDGEVRAGARAVGANIVSSEQLLAIARR